MQQLKSSPTGYDDRYIIYVASRTSTVEKADVMKKLLVIWFSVTLQIRFTVSAFLHLL
jgi:hypothetical protein